MQKGVEFVGTVDIIVVGPAPETRGQNVTSNKSDLGDLAKHETTGAVRNVACPPSMTTTAPAETHQCTGELWTASALSLRPL